MGKLATRISIIAFAPLLSARGSAEDADGVSLQFGFTISGDASEAEVNRADQVMNSCMVQANLDYLYAELFALQVPTGAEREALWEEYVACLEGAGVTVDHLELNMHPNDLIGYFMNTSEGRWDFEINMAPNPQVERVMSACIQKCHYSVLPTND